VKLREFLRRPPRTWFWCYSSLALNPAQQKKSPGVLALVPGATLGFTVDSRMASEAGREDAIANQSRLELRVRATIEHLVSYEGMGIVSVACVGGCSCDAHRIDAHRVDAHRNVSVFLQHAFDVRGGSSKCGVRMQVLSETSSGGHKFKVRTVTLALPENGAER